MKSAGLRALVQLESQFISFDTLDRYAVHNPRAVFPLLDGPLGSAIENARRICIEHNRVANGSTGRDRELKQNPALDAPFRGSHRVLRWNTDNRNAVRITGPRPDVEPSCEVRVDVNRRGRDGQSVRRGRIALRHLQIRGRRWLGRLFFFRHFALAGLKFRIALEADKLDDWALAGLSPAFLTHGDEELHKEEKPEGNSDGDKRRDPDPNPLHDGLVGNLIGRDGNIKYTRLSCGIHDLDKQSVLGVFVRLNHHGPLRIFSVQSLDVGSNRTNVNLSPIDPDLIALRDGHKDIASLFDGRGGCIGSVDVDSGLLHERGRDDEEDEHDEDHVEHGRQIDFRLIFLFVAFPSHGRDGLPCWETGSRLVVGHAVAEALAFRLGETLNLD